MADKGYDATTVADPIKHAEVSRATFCQHFDLSTFRLRAGLLHVRL
ncbi:TetR family transcriptional regulator [Mycolicibacterium xanthum]|nr:TetR family transcriptional regulator [Mycolicibacterium xanthum]